MLCLNSDLSKTASINVKEAMVLTMHASSVGDVYFKLVKYIFRVKLTLKRSMGMQLTLLW